MQVIADGNHIHTLVENKEGEILIFDTSINKLRDCRCNYGKTIETIQNCKVEWPCPYCGSYGLHDCDKFDVDYVKRILRLEN